MLWESISRAVNTGQSPLQWTPLACTCPVRWSWATHTHSCCFSRVSKNLLCKNIALSQGCLLVIWAAQCAIWQNLLYKSDGSVFLGGFFICFVFNGFPIGVTLDEMCLISAAHSNVVPVCSDAGRMRLLDFTSPFLFSRDQRYYGSGLMPISAPMLSVHWGNSLA